MNLFLSTIFPSRIQKPAPAVQRSRYTQLLACHAVLCYRMCPELRDARYGIAKARMMHQGLAAERLLHRAFVLRLSEGHEMRSCCLVVIIQHLNPLALPVMLGYGMVEACLVLWSCPDSVQYKGWRTVRVSDACLQGVDVAFGLVPSAAVAVSRGRGCHYSAVPLLLVRTCFRRDASICVCSRRGHPP